MNIKEQIRTEIERRLSWRITPEARAAYNNTLRFLDTLPEQPVSDHHEIEVEFRGEKVTISREFYRDGKMNYSTSEQDDNAIWSALRAWCEKKGITAFELYPEQPEQPVPTIMTNEMLMGEIKPKKKSNALFDKCVENCDPAIMKEVSDNVDKMLGKQPVEGLGCEMNK